MKQGNRFVKDMLDFDLAEARNDKVWRAGNPVSEEQTEGDVRFRTPFYACQINPEHFASFTPEKEAPPRFSNLLVRAYGDAVVRLTVAFTGEIPSDADNVMLEMDESLQPVPLGVKDNGAGWDCIDERGLLRMKVDLKELTRGNWTEPHEAFEARVFPDGKAEVAFNGQDLFFPGHMESMGLAYVERNQEVVKSLFSFTAGPDEKYAGTGERFSRMNLAGQTMILENVDALGVNSRRAYKNIPFYLSSRGYGLLILTPAHVRLSLGDISTRAAQGLVEDGLLDLFFIGGGSVERIVYNYRRITGFPRPIPLWSLGTWMSRMTYFSAEETKEVGRKLREGEFPCDVLHLDTGWFREDWKCEWEFSPERFPDPAGFMREMREKGFRITLWQYPTVGADTKHFETAKRHQYIVPKKQSTGSDFTGEKEYGGSIDFSNPDAVRWYQGLLTDLLRMGASAIKTDFGEEIEMEAVYHGLPSRLLHNLYALLYQKAAYEITAQTTGEGVIWARSGWVGSQRYPVHWGGDAASTWDGLAGTIRGGLHIGVSGFAFWSHDVPGFHGLPNFMVNRPADDLYVRWTQVGVFTSHLRYHGTTPREPYAYPEVAPLVRRWLRLRYALMPYLWEESQKAVSSGYPIFRAMIFHHPEDPICWNIDDQFYCGDVFLVASVLNSEGVRSVYLPDGSWTDFWTGEVVQGPVMLRNVKSPLERIPVFVKTGAVIKVYPDLVAHTGEMDLAKAVELRFDHTYRGFSSSILGKVTDWL